MGQGQRVVVMGQGYVGLPLAVRAVEVGYHVVGFELDVNRTARLAGGDSYVGDIPSARLQDVLATGRYIPSNDVADLAEFDVAIISVPTPLREGVPDLSFIEDAARMLAPHLRAGSCVVLESTTYPGTTEELVGPLLEDGSGLRAGADFCLGYSPERINPGDPNGTLEKMPKVVSGIDAASLQRVQAFYNTIVEQTVPVKGTREAELTKLLENTFRHVNIARSDEVTDAAIHQAAALHGPRWGDPTLADEPAMRSPFGDRAELYGHYYTASSDGCIARLGHALEDDVQQLIRDFVPLIGTWAAGPGTPVTVVHGDFRPDNFLIGQTPGAAPMVIVDWQTVSLGLGVADVAYFVGGAFEPERRRTIERDLLARYRSALATYGVDYDPDDCWRDYTWGTLHGVFISVCATMMADQTERGDAMLTLMARRHARHALDLGALDLLGSDARS